MSRLWILAVVAIVNTLTVVYVLRAASARKVPPHVASLITILLVVSPISIVVFDFSAAIAARLRLAPISLVLLLALPLIGFAFVSQYAKITELQSSHSELTISAALGFQLTRSEGRMRSSLKDQSESADTVDCTQSEVLVVLPAYMEEDSISGLVTELKSYNFDILVIDDGSTDTTADQAEKAGAEVLVLSRNLGVGAAVRTGLLMARKRGYAHVAKCDADGQHPPKEVARLISLHVESGSELTIGVRDFEKDVQPILKRAGMKLLASLASRSGEHTFSDATSGLQIMDSNLYHELARKMPNYWLGDTFEVYRAANARGLTINEVVVDMLPRQGGTASTVGIKAAAAVIRATLLVLSRASLDLDRREDGIVDASR